MSLFLEKKVRRNKMDKAKRRTLRTRYKIKKRSLRKRLSVFRSNNHLYAQIIDDIKGITLVSASTLENSIKKTIKDEKIHFAKCIGQEIAKRSLKKGITEVVFDKGKYKYHGNIKILADSARESGLVF